MLEINSTQFTAENTINISKLERVNNTELLFELNPACDNQDKINKAKEDLMTVIYSNLDIKPENKNYKIEIINKDNNYYLKITNTSKEGSDYKLYEIKNRLNIADGVLKENNNLAEITNRPEDNISDDATIEPNKSIIIPLDELGKEKYFHITAMNRKELENKAKSFLEVAK